jgi:hypothetical protein
MEPFSLVLKMSRLLLTIVFLNVGSAIAAEPIDLDPKLIESSPVLQRWLKQIPDVAADIANDPSFRTRYQIGISRFDQRTGLSLGIEDLRIGQTPLTASTVYRRDHWGADLRYYVRSLGSYVNIAPVIGYRQLDQTEGLHVGVRSLFVLSRGGGADIALSQTWVSPFNEATSLTTLSFGYAVTHNLRISTEFQRQRSSNLKDTRIGIGLEWMP